jgi:CRP-like cAMP-binding protein
MKDIELRINQLGIPDELKRILIEKGDFFRIKKKSFFLEQEKLCKYVGIVLKGDFRTYMVEDGVERTVSIDGESFDSPFITDYVAFLNRAKSNRNIQALTDSKVIILTYEQVMAFFELNIDTQRFGRQLAENMLKENQRIMYYLYFLSPEERYMEFEKRYSNYLQKISLKDIASIIGITPETLSRIRKKNIGK